MEEYAFILEAITEEAVLINDGDEDIWLPKSQCNCVDGDWEDYSKGDCIEIEVPDWLAEKKGIV